MQLGQQPLAAHLVAALVEDHALDVPRARNLARPKRADEHIPSPFRELVACIEGHPRRRDRGYPEHDRLLHAFTKWHFRLPRSLIRAPEAHERPAVVAARKDDVDLVSAIRALLGLPDGAGLRMKDETLLIAMSERV